jgi:uncharacterized membrane protein YfcA
LLYTLTGFGFAVLSSPAFLLFVDPPQAIQLVIIISTALSITTLPGLWRAIAPALLLRLTLGSIAGLPLGLVALRHADPVLVRRLVGATILAFPVLLVWLRHRGPHRSTASLGLKPGYDLAAGMVSGVATALVGMPGPPALIYLLLAGMPPRIVRATLLSFFALAYSSALLSHMVSIFLILAAPIEAGILIPFAALGAVAGRPLGDRLSVDAFARLAILLLAAPGCTLAAPAGLLPIIDANRSSQDWRRRQ